MSTRVVAFWAAVVAAIAAVTVALAVEPGQPDPGFGSGGRVTAAAPGVALFVTDVVRQPGGGIVVVADAGNDEIALARFTPSGVLDTSFGGAKGSPPGFAITSTPSPMTAAGAAVDGQGRILVSGNQTPPGAGNRMMVARFTPGGDLDPTFSTDGIATATPADDSQATDVAVNGAGVVIVGDAQSNMAIAAFGPEGAPDATGMPSGTRRTDIPGFALAVAVDTQGRFVLAGLNAQRQAVIARLTADGLRDPSFAAAHQPAGWTSSAFPSSSNAQRPQAQFADVALDPQGRPVVAGSGQELQGNAIPSRPLLVRYTTGGGLDGSFGGDGVADLPALAGSNGFQAVAIEPTGRVVAAGNDFDGGPGIVARARVDGAADAGFDGDGAALLRFEDGGTADVPGLTLTPDGRALLAGTSTTTASGGGTTPAPQKTDRVGLAAVVLDRPPTAVLSAPDSAAVGQTVTLDASKSSDPDGLPLSFAYDTGDGKVGPPAGPTTTFVPQSGGVRTVRVAVTDAYGLPAEASHTITISGAADPGVSDTGPKGADTPPGLLTKSLPGTFDVSKYLPSDQAPKIARPPRIELITTKPKAVKEDGKGAIVGTVVEGSGEKPLTVCVKPAKGACKTATLTPFFPVTDLGGGGGLKGPQGLPVAGAFSFSFPIDTTAQPGTRTVTVVASQGGVTTKLPFSFEVQRVNFPNVVLRGMEINQGVQKTTIATLRTTAPSRNANYDGVPLAGGKTTIVRVWGGLTGTPKAEAVPVHLYGYYRSGGVLHALPGSPISPMASPATLPVTSATGVSSADRGSATAAYVFQLPWSWVDGSHHFIRLRADLNQGSPSVPECGACSAADNRIRIKAIRVEKTKPLVVKALGTYFNLGGTHTALAFNFPFPFHISVTTGGTWTYVNTQAPSDLYQPLIGLTPGSVVVPDNYLAWADITPAVRCDAFDLQFGDCVGTSFDDKGTSISNLTFNVYKTFGVAGDTAFALYDRTYGRGWERGLCCDKNGKTVNWAIAGFQRRILSVAHELYHSIGFPHASNACDASGGMVWSPDNQGDLQGFPIDTTRTTPGPGGTTLPFGFMPSEVNTDLMGYCLGDGPEPYQGAWISSKNWKNYIDGADITYEGTDPVKTGKIPGRKLPTSAAARRTRAEADVPVIAVNVRLGRGQVQTFRLSPGTGRPSTSLPGGSDVHIRSLAGDGRVLEDIAAPVEAEDAEQAENVLSGAQLTAAGVAAIELVVRGDVVARMNRSAGSPVVQLEQPGAGRSTISATKPVELRWKAGDPDGERLETIVEWSTDGGKTYRTVSSVGSASQTQIPGASFESTKDGRIRITTSDGFNSASAVSGPVTAEGPGPSVQIVGPRRLRVRAGAPVSLQAVGLSETNEVLPDRAITWFDGKRSIGRGARVTISTLPAGRRRVRAVVRQAGRTAQATVVVQVVAVKAEFVGLSVPARVSRGATSLVVRTASSVPATLRVGHVSRRVGARPVTVRLAIRPGRSPLRVRLTLRTTAGTVAVTRIVRRS